MLTLDTHKCELTDNTIYCLAQGQYRSVELRGVAEGYGISLTPAFLYASNCAVHGDFGELVRSSNAELDDLVALMHLECLRPDPRSQEILRSLFKVFMICLRRADPVKDHRNAHLQNDNRIVQGFFSSLQQHFAIKKLVAEYADELCITPNYLNAVVKRQTGFPASHHIQQFIIMEAKRQAIYSQSSMKEVADRLGFDDCAHFSKFFKNFSGMNFSTFKRSFG